MDGCPPFPIPLPTPTQSWFFADADAAVGMCAAVCGVDEINLSGRAEPEVVLLDGNLGGTGGDEGLQLQ